MKGVILAILAIILMLVVPILTNSALAQDWSSHHHQRHYFQSHFYSVPQYHHYSSPHYYYAPPRHMGPQAHLGVGLNVFGLGVGVDARVSTWSYTPRGAYYWVYQNGCYRLVYLYGR